MKKLAKLLCVALTFAVVLCAFVACGPTVETVVVGTAPTKEYYVNGVDTTIDLTGGTLVVTYDDGTQETIDMTAEGVEISAPNLTTNGRKRVNVTYAEITVNFIIEVGLPRYTVTFDLGYTGAQNVEQTVTQGDYVEALTPAPTRTGYQFDGWFTTSTFDVPFTFDVTAITADVTIYAKWSELHTVSFDLNYEGAPEIDDQVIAHNSSATAPTPAPERADYNFGGWFTDEECTQRFNFATPITTDVTLYALWTQEEVAAEFDVTFDLNYPNAPTASVFQVVEGETAVAPADPTRAPVTTKGHQATNFVFGGWYADAACTTEFDFDTVITEDVTIYAKWTGQYTFEGEHISLIDPYTNEPFTGLGYSGSCSGSDMVDGSEDQMGASNGYHLAYLNTPYQTMTYTITSDRATSDATIVLRLAAENMDITLTPENFEISINGNPIDYSEIEFVDVPSITEDKMPFADFTIAINVTLVEGTNTITLTPTNTDSQGGTMAATAPLLDCMKITTSANLTWTPVVENESGQ